MTSITLLKHTANDLKQHQSLLLTKPLNSNLQFTRFRIIGRSVASLAIRNSKVPRQSPTPRQYPTKSLDPTAQCRLSNRQATTFRGKADSATMFVRGISAFHLRGKVVDVDFSVCVRLLSPIGHDRTRGWLPARNEP